MKNLNIPKVNVNNIVNLPKHNINKVTLSSYTKACNNIIYERRNPKVITDEHKLFNTKPHHKYF